MLTKIHNFLISLSTENHKEKDQSSLQLACAVLLAEVMHADGKNDDNERQEIVNQLNQHFSLSREILNDILKQAEVISEQATDYYQFTSKINLNFPVADKIKLVEMLWSVANADGEISAIEQHTISKIADLLHLRHNEYVKSKLKILLP